MAARSARGADEATLGGVAETSDRAAPTVDAPPERVERVEREHRSFFSELPFLLLVAFVLALVLKTFVVQAFFIPSSSMEPTLQVGDRVLVNKLAYMFREPERGEVVVFTQRDASAQGPAPTLVERVVGSVTSGLGFARPGARDFIKRIIGLPGDMIEMRGGVVFVNGESLPESRTTEGGYLSQPDLNDFGPVRVEAGHYFMMGDNRPNSSDSRFSLGQIPRDAIVGRAFVVIWPVGQAGTLPIWSYGPAGEAAVPAAAPAATPTPAAA